MTHAELSERMTAAELLEWIQFDRVHRRPADTSTALICLRMDRLAGNRSSKIDDYLPRLYQPVKVADRHSLAARLVAWARSRISAQRGEPSPPHEHQAQS